MPNPYRALSLSLNPNLLYHSRGMEESGEKEGTSERERASQTGQPANHATGRTEKTERKKRHNQNI